MEYQKKYRFVPRRYGYGVMPISRQGRLVTIMLVGVLLLVAMLNNFFTISGPSEVQVLWYVLEVLVVMIVFTIMMKSKTDGEMKRRRGKSKDEIQKDNQK